MLKYADRGFKPIAFDPYDLREVSCDLKIDHRKAPKSSLIPIDRGWRFDHSHQDQDGGGDLDNEVAITRGVNKLDIDGKPRQNINDNGSHTRQGILDITEQLNDYQKSNNVVWVCGHDHHDWWCTRTNTWRCKYSLILMPGSMTWKLGFVKTLVGNLWTDEHDALINSSDDRLLVVCSYVKTRMFAYKCLMAMGARGVVINEKNEYVSDAQFHMKEELTSRGWTARNKDCPSANNMENGFYGSPAICMGGARTGCFPAKIEAQYRAKDSMDENIHVKTCIDNNESPGDVVRRQRFIYGRGTTTTSRNEFYKRMGSTVWITNKSRSIGKNPERCAIKCMGTNCTSEWTRMIGTSTEQPLCIRCWYGGGREASAAIRECGVIRRGTVCLHVKNKQNKKTVLNGFLTRNSQSILNEDDWLFYLCNDEDNVSKTHGYQSMRKEMHCCHDNCIDSLRTVNGMLYRTQMDTYDKDGSLGKTASLQKKQRLGKKYMMTQVKAYGLRLSDERLDRNMTDTSWKMTNVEARMKIVRREHVRMMNDEGEMTPVGLKRWAEVYTNDSLMSREEVEVMRLMVHNIVIRYGNHLKSHTAGLRDLTREEQATVDYYNKEFG